MTLATLWAEQPLWRELFTDHDYVLVDSLDRLDENAVLSPDAARVLLLLAKSVRLNHVVLSLKADELMRLCTEQLWTTRNDDGVLEVADGIPSPQNIDAGVRDIVAMGPMVAERLRLDERVSISGAPIIVNYVDDDASTLAFRRYAYAEEVVAAALLRSATRLSGLASVESDVFVAGLSRERLDDIGVQAIRNMLDRQLSVLTGGPGRGKTTVIASLLIGLKQHAERSNSSFSVALCAPTAKAAVRMRAAVDEQLANLGESIEDLARYVVIDERSGSVHRLLGIRPDDTKSLRTLDHDFVIVDEVSMLEFTLLAKLLEHAPRAHVVLVGDPDQLASVNVGAALRDIVDGARASRLDYLVSELEVNYRSNHDIDVLSSAVNTGEYGAVVAALEAHPASLRWVRDARGVMDDVVEWATELREAALSGHEGECFAMLTRRAVLCATQRGEGSVGWWREMLERKLPSDLGTSVARFRIGSPVLVTQNEQSVVVDVSQRLANGDVGVVMAHEDIPSVHFGPSNNPRVRLESQLGPAESAWSTTIHKSQGSEYDEVIVSLPHASSQTLTKELLYTAVTRAKSKVTIVASAEALSRCVSRETFRVSGLVDRLRVRVRSSMPRDGIEQD